MQCPYYVLVYSVFVAFAVVNAQLEQQDVPYITFRGANLTNHSYVNLLEVGSSEANDLRCRTDLVTCCNREAGQDRGDWFFPDGTRLPFSGGGSILFLSRHSQSVSIRRQGSAMTVSGIYRCTIETNAVRSDDGSDMTAREIAYVGLYSDGGDVTIPDDISFTGLMDSNGQTIGYALACVSTGGPVTNVTWTRDSEVVTEGAESVLDDQVTSQYTHTLTVTGRLEATYTCTVSNNKPSMSFSQLTVEAPNPPLSLQVSQNGQTSVLVTWAPPPGNGITITTYTITLTIHQGEMSVKTNVDGSETSTTVEWLTEAATYSVTIVAHSNTLSSTVTGPVNIRLEALSMMVSASPSSLLMLGDLVTLICTVALPAGVIGTPSFRWEGPGGSILGMESTLPIDSIRASGAGRYTCTINIGFFSVSNTTDITVQIPALLSSITESRSAPLYAATSYSLTCDYILNDLIDNSPSIMVEWTVDRNAVDTSQSRIAAQGNSLLFNPLATSDSGSYICTVTLLPQEFLTVLDPQQQPSSPLAITIADLPVPDVATTSDSVLDIGDQLTLRCDVSVVPLLIIEPRLEWVDPQDNVVTSGTGDSLTHTVTVDSTSAAGVYVCHMNVDVTEIALSVAVEGSTVITVQIPPPSVVITADRRSILYAGTSLTLTCVASLDPRVDTPPDITLTWTGPRTIPGQWDVVTDTVGSDSTFSGSLSISPLADGRDDGEYTCTVLAGGSSYILEAESHDSTTILITSFPMLVVSITMTGSLLTSQSYTLECTVNVIDGLIQSPRLELMAPDGTSLALEPSGTTLTYTLSSLSTSDEGEYACTTILAIPGSGINRQASATASINVVDAYPVEELMVLSRGSLSLEFSWQPPQLGHEFTTQFTVMCTPLLSGIPMPQPVSTSSGDEHTLPVMGLFPGVQYDCSVVTVTTQGESEPESIVLYTEETVPTGPPLSFQVVVGVTEITFTWSPPEVTLRNGVITEYTLSCSSGGTLMILTTFTESGKYTVDGFSASTSYDCSVLAANSVGSGPPASLSFTTQDADASSSEGFNSTPVVAGVVVVVLVVAVMVIVVIVLIMLIKRRHNKYNLRRARPNSYISRTADSTSASVTTNPSATNHTVVKDGATAVDPAYEMISTYKKLPPPKRPPREYMNNDVDVTTNQHVTSEIGNHSATDGGRNPEYESIHVYRNIGPGALFYEMPKKRPTSGQVSPDTVISDEYVAPHGHYSTPLPANSTNPTADESSLSVYSVPHSRHNTLTQEGPPPKPAPYVGKKTASQYDRLASRKSNPTSMQGTSLSLPSTVKDNTPNLYNEPRSRQNTMTEQSSPNTIPNHRDDSTPTPISTEPQANGQVILTDHNTESQHTTYNVPRPSSMTAERPPSSHGDLVEIDLGSLGERPALASPPPQQDEGYQNVPNSPTDD